MSGFSLLTELEVGEENSRLADTTVAQPLLFAIQVAVTVLLRAQGVEATAVTGHSVGEVAAAWAAGALDLDQAVRVIVARSRAQGLTRGTGRMAAVGMSEAAMRTFINQLDEDIDVEIAGINSPYNITLSGSLHGLTRIKNLLATRDVFFRLLDLDYAFHSSQMEPIRDRLLESLQEIAPVATGPVVFVSTVTGDELGGLQLDAEYWWRNVREPVRFADAVTKLADLGCRVFIEIGPHAILQRYVRESLAAGQAKVRVLSTLLKNADGVERLVDTAMRAHLLSTTPNRGVFFPHPGQYVRLPNYAWQRERHWYPKSSESLHSFERRRVHPLLGWRLPDVEVGWENILDPLVLPWLADHKIGGAMVLPGAAYAEMALAAGRQWMGCDRLAFEELDIVAPMVFDGEHARTVRFSLHPRDGVFQIKSQQRLSADEWTLHATGRLLEPAATAYVRRVGPVSQPIEFIESDTHYRLATLLGLDYGPAFQGLVSASVAGDCLQATLAVPVPLIAEQGYCLHPALLDVCYQSLVDFFHREIETGQGVAFLPVKIGRLDLHQQGLPDHFLACLRRRGRRSVLVDFEIYAADDRLLASITDCRFRLAPLKHGELSKTSSWRTTAWLRPHPAEERTADLPLPGDLASFLHRVFAPDQMKREPWFREAFPLFEALTLSLAYQACQALADQEGGLQRLSFASSYVRWLSELLVQEGMLIRDDSGDVFLAVDHGLPEAQHIWNTLLREHPACLPQLLLMGRVGRQLPMILTGETDGRDFLHDLWRSIAAETFFHDDPAYAGSRLALRRTLLYMAAALPSHRRLRVLEIVWRSSGLPRAVCAALPEDRLEYVVVQVSEPLSQHQQDEYQDLSNVTIARLNEADWELVADTSLPANYDVVLLHHVCHQIPAPRSFLAKLHRRLAVGGCLLLAERFPDWSSDFVAGLDPAWWGAEVARPADRPRSALLLPAVWEDALRQEGFDDIHQYQEAAAQGLEAGAYLLMARRPDDDADRAAPSCKPESWLLLVDEASRPLAGRVCAGLESSGQRVFLADRLSEVGLSAIDHVVRLRGWNAEPDEASALLAGVLDDVQALLDPAGKPARLWIVVRNGALLSAGSAVVGADPVQSALWGFGRVVMNEHPELHCTLIDLACDPDLPATAMRLEDELLRPDGSEEIIVGATGRYVPVMQEEQRGELTASCNSDRFRLDFHVPGKLRNLRWLEHAEAPLLEGQIEVRPQAAGLNFRDVMYLMGLLPDEAVESGFAGASLGLEFSGIVTRVGPGVYDLCPGDKVMGFGPACFASHVVTRADAVAPMPGAWSFEAAATVPTVFFTVYYALKHLADVQPGERVLIHGAAGGVGIAAMQLAKHLGAEIFVTAGSEEKRDFARLLGADHIFDSRSLAFADAILEATDGQGVDVVLNSLAGEAMRRNLQVLKPFGRFLELGKRDFFENTPVGLRPFKNNISYFGIDADQLLTGRPLLAARMFREVMELFDQGALSPLPHRVFSADRVVEAFRTMQQARHIGKIVISLAEAKPLISRPLETGYRPRFSNDSTWLVTGGVSGFGLESARWLAKHGVGALALVGRRGLDTPGAAQAVEELTSLGARVEVFACDITDRRAVADMMASIERNLPPLKGVLHAAMVIDDRLLTRLDAQSMDAVLQPKLTGAWNLHVATLGLHLDYFVLYSSITTAIGNPGQANYVAANAALEGLAGMRRGMGLPAVAIGWGPIGDAGYLTRNAAVRDSLAQRLGKPPLSAAQALDELSRIQHTEGNLTVANFDWASLARLLPSASARRFGILNSGLKDAGLTEGETDLRALIAGKSAGEVAAIVRSLITQEVAQILAIGADRLDPARSLHDLGLDSLMAVELAAALEQRLGIQLPAMMLNDSPTVDKVTQRIVDKILGSSDDDAAPAGSTEDLVRDLARQHGESMETTDVQQIVQNAQSLSQQQGRRSA